MYKRTKETKIAEAGLSLPCFALLWGHGPPPRSFARAHARPCSTTFNGRPRRSSPNEPQPLSLIICAPRPPLAAPSSLCCVCVCAFNENRSSSQGMAPGVGGGRCRTYVYFFASSLSLAHAAAAASCFFFIQFNDTHDDAAAAALFPKIPWSTDLEQPTATGAPARVVGVDGGARAQRRIGQQGQPTSHHAATSRSRSKEHHRRAARGGGGGGGRRRAHGLAGGCGAGRSGGHGYVLHGWGRPFWNVCVFMRASVKSVARR
jgi:hypothetical protein